MKTLGILIFFVFFFQYASANSAVSYELNGGRLGDNLINYLHAKWISYLIGIPVIYTPFKYSDALALSEIEISPSNTYNQICSISSDSFDLLQVQHLSSTLFQLSYFPETSWGRNCLRSQPKFYIDWDDPTFRELIRKSISPKRLINYSIFPPKNQISVAIHVRTGAGEPPILCPHKAPSSQLMIQCLKYLYKFLGEKPIFVYLFSDSETPELLMREFQRAVEDIDVSITTAKSPNGFDNNVLEDFFSMTLFDCAIHGGSNYAICAGLIADYDVEIGLVAERWEHHGARDLQVIMRLHFDKLAAPEYRIIHL